MEKQKIMRIIFVIISIMIVSTLLYLFVSEYKQPSVKVSLDKSGIHIKKKNNEDFRRKWKEAMTNYEYLHGKSESNIYGRQPKNLNYDNDLVTVNVGSFNTFLRSPVSLFKDSQIKRAKMIPDAINNTNKDLDIIVLQELFDTKSKKIVDDKMEKYFPYRTEVVGKNPLSSGTLVNGGIRIYSKHKILDSKYEIFNNGIEEDKISGKGIVYAKINKGGLNIHVFGTHLQSGIGKEKDGAKKEQMMAISQMMEDLNIPENDIVFVAGDLNTWHISRIKENFNSGSYKAYKDINSTTSASYARRDRSEIYSPKVIDFVLSINDYKKPIQFQIFTDDIDTDKDYKTKKITGKIEGTKFKRYGKQMKMKTLSDHKMVHGKFVFRI